MTEEPVSRRIRLPPDFWAALEILAVANERPVAAELRAAVVHHAARYGITIRDTVRPQSRPERWPFD